MRRCGGPAPVLQAVDEGRGDVDGRGHVAVPGVEEGAPDDQSADPGSARASAHVAYVSSGLPEGSPPSSSVGSVVAAITRAMSSTTGIFSQL